jgi:predicted dehydrogenase
MDRSRETEVAETLGWGIIGCGDVADRKAGDAFNAIPGSRLASVMRRDAAGAESFAERHSAAAWTTDAGEVLANPDVDIVYIATPPANHLEYGLAAAQAGKACLIEKPAGRSLAELRQLRDAFRRANRPLYVSYYRRHLPRFEKVREILDSGVLGEMVSIDYRMSKRAKTKSWALDVAASGGGHFYGLSGHMLDLFDYWFGPIEHSGSTVTNVIPAHDAEDAVSLSFRTAGGAVGTAVWNFAASHSSDQLVIDGVRGRITMRGTSTDGPVRVAFDPKARIRISQSKLRRWVTDGQKRLGLPIGETLRFTRVLQPHRPLLEQIVSDVSRSAVSFENLDAALRTAEIVDRALTPYYGDRSGDFWNHSSRYQSLRARASARNSGPVPEAYRLGAEDLARFEQDGYLGPFRCDADWQHLIVPVKKGRNLHLLEADVFDVCTHPSIVRRIAQLLGSRHFTFFKSRFVVKMPRDHASVAWHQDVGKKNGGFAPDGRPVPTIAAWMALDAVDLENGGLELIPGSHKRLIGDYNKQIKSGLVEKGVLTASDLERSVPVILKPGEFIIFHAWLLHGSGPNDSDRRRAALNIRFAPPGYECEDEFAYIPITCGDVAPSDRMFRNEVWQAGAGRAASAGI